MRWAAKALFCATRWIFRLFSVRDRVCVVSVFLRIYEKNAHRRKKTRAGGVSTRKERIKDVLCSFELVLVGIGIGFGRCGFDVGDFSSLLLFSTGNFFTCA